MACPSRHARPQVRAFQPWPLAFTALPAAKGPVRVNLLSVVPADVDPGGAKPGDILAADAKHGIVVMAGDGPARLVRLQPEGKRPMRDTDYVKGTKIIP